MNRTYPLLIRENFIVSGRTEIAYPVGQTFHQTLQAMAVRKVWAQSREQDSQNTQHANELRQLSGIQAKIQAARTQLEENQTKLRAQKKHIKDAECCIKVLHEQMDAAKEEVKMWKKEAEASEKVVTSLREDYNREVRELRSVIPRSAAGADKTYTDYLVDKEGEKAYTQMVALIKRLVTHKKKLQDKVSWLYGEGKLLCNKTEQQREAVPGLEARLANLDEAIQAKRATLAELDKIENNKFAKLDSMEYLLEATSHKLEQQHELTQALNNEIEHLKVVLEACQMQSEPSCRPTVHSQAAITTHTEGAAPAPEGLCVSSRCSLADAPMSINSFKRAVSTARVHGSIAGRVDSRYADIESLCDADCDGQVLVSGSKREQQHVGHLYTLKSFAAKARNACKKLLIKRSNSKVDSCGVRSSSSSKVGCDRVINPDDMLPATTIWKWSTCREYRRDNPLYIKAGDLQMMLDSPPIGGHAPNSGVPTIW